MTSVTRTIAEVIVTSFYRFLARFSGRRRGVDSMREGAVRISLFPLISILALQTLSPLVEACSSRSVPKPRPPVVSTTRPNVTFHTFPCPEQYEQAFCLNGATCFSLKIGESMTYNCICTDGYNGPRCEFKDLDGSYRPSRHRVMLETASIASGAVIAVFLVVVICMYVYMRLQRKHKDVVACHGDIGTYLEKKTSLTRELPSRIASHHITRERGDNISLAVYDVTEPT